MATLDEFNKRYQERIGRFQGLDSLDPLTKQQEQEKSGEIMAGVFRDQERFGGFGNQQRASRLEPLENKFEMLEPIGVPEKTEAKPKEEDWLTKIRKALYRVLTTPEMRKKHEKDKKEAEKIANEQFEEFLIKEELRAKGIQID
jgi:hypothetical protein